MNEQEELTSLDLVDTKVPFRYFGTRNHVWGSFSRGKDPLSPCVQMNMINDMPGVIASQVNKGIVRVIFKRDPKVAVRFVLSQDGEEIARINDKFGKKELLKLFTKPMELWLEVPKGNRSLKYLRSAEAKKMRKESRERRKGKPARRYKKPSEKGYRNGSGQGLAHMWPKK
jgi:hypothetical protein